MPRYIALLRGVSPMNAKMADLRCCFEKAGFTQVKTILGTGNVAFDAPSKSAAVLARQIETAMEKHLDRTFQTIVRSTVELQKLVAPDPFTNFRLPKNAKRVVTFLREHPRKGIALPPEIDGARILAMQGREVFTAYVPHPKGPVFMRLIEKTFGKDVTTRTWETVKKCAIA